jgi:WD40 repeat protein
LEKGYNYVHDVKFSPDGTVLASALWDNKVVLFDAATGEQLNKLDEYGEFNQALAFSPDSTMLASQSLDGMTKIWNVQKGEIRHTIPGYLIQGQSFSNNNKLLALKANKSTVTVYDTNTGELKYTLSGHNNIFNITFSKNDLYLAAGSGKDFKVWSMSTGLEVITTPTVNGGCTYTHSVSGESLAIGNALHHLTFSNPRTLCTISRPSWVKSMDISGSVVIFGGTSMVKIENYPGNPGLTSIMGYDALCVDASTNTDLIMAGVSDKSIHIWELETQEEILNLPAHESPPTSVQFSPNNKLIATTSLDGTIHIWGVH